MDFFAQNLKCLLECDPELAERVALQPFPENVTVVRSKDGFPVPRIAGVALHSQYRPVEEGSKAIGEFVFNPERNTVVYGLGYGYHVQALLQKAGNVAVITSGNVTYHSAFVM